MTKVTWVTQAKLAKDLKVPSQYVSNWIIRGKIKSKYFPDFDKTLVNPESFTMKKLIKNKDGIWIVKTEK